jgi:hypothetical protein
MPITALTFRLKRGFCHITDEDVLMSRWDRVEDFSRSNPINAMIFGISTELIVVAIIGYFGYKSYLIGNYINIGLMGIFLIMAVYRIVHYFLYSSDNQIKREDITLVEYKPGIPYLTIPQFVLYYEVNNKQKKRLIPLSGLLYGKSARVNAMKIMKDSGLYKPGELNEDLLDSF